MLEPTKVTINGRHYTVNPLPPLEALQFYHGRLKSFRTGESMFPHAMTVLGQCLDENLNELANKEHFAAWFGKHPEDLLELQNRATEALLDPFYPKENDTSKSAKTS